MIKHSDGSLRSPYNGDIYWRPTRDCDDVELLPQRIEKVFVQRSTGGRHTYDEAWSTHKLLSETRDWFRYPKTFDERFFSIEIFYPTNTHSFCPVI